MNIQKIFLFFSFLCFFSFQETNKTHTYNRTKLAERYKDLTEEEIEQKIKEKEERRANRRLEKEERRKKRNKISFEEAEKIHKRQIEEGHRPYGITDEEYKKLLNFREKEEEKIEQKKKEVEEDLRNNITKVLKELGLENNEKINKSEFKTVYNKLFATEDSVKYNKTMNDTEKEQVLKFHQDITEYFMKDIPEEIEVINLITYFNTKRLNTLVNDFLYDQQNKQQFQNNNYPDFNNYKSKIIKDDSGSYEFVDLSGNKCMSENRNNFFDFSNKNNEFINNFNKEDL